MAALSLLMLVSEVEAFHPPNPDKKVEKEVAKLFDIEAQFQEVPVFVDGQKVSDLIHEGDQAFALESNEGRLGYVLSTSAMGRYDYFDYSIIYAKDLTVMGVLVTTYRSSHGAGICSKGWLKQFKGYQGEEIRIGKEIDSISGATFSSTSMVEDMKRSYSLMKELEASGCLN